MRKRKCSGRFCPMQHNTINVGECQCTDTCEYYTPLADFSGMEAVIDIAAKHFGLETDIDKEKLKIFFDAYVSQYCITVCFPLIKNNFTHSRWMASEYTTDRADFPDMLLDI